MINLILHYLLALPDNVASDQPGVSSSVSKARKRKSLDLATMLAERAVPTATPLLFNLVDLILACLSSRNQQTIHVTLQLVSAILKRHHRYAIATLLRTDNAPVNRATRTVGAQEQEVEFIMSLAGTIGGEDDFDEVYQLVLRDTMTRLEAHPCSLKLVAPRASTSNQRLPDSLPGAPKEVEDHTLRPDDPLLNSLLDLLETFFVNQVETNLSVTETLVDLAVCGFMKIEGWLTRNPTSYVYDEVDTQKRVPTGDEEEDIEVDELLEDLPSPTPEQKQLRAMEQCRQRPQWSTESLPRVFNVLRKLEEQVASYKRTIPRFDELVQQRRDAFGTADAMLHHAGPTPRPTPISEDLPEYPSFDEVSRNASPSRPSTLEGLAHRLLSELGTPSRSGSPRGRKELGRSSGSGNATPGKSGLSSSKEVSHSRGRGTPGRSHSPGRIPDTIDPTQKAREDVLARQMAEFAAMDQTILSKKVGLPQVKLAPIPIKFDKEPVSEPTETADVKDDQAEELPGEAETEKEDDSEGAVAENVDQTPDEAKADEVKVDEVKAAEVEADEVEDDEANDDEAEADDVKADEEANSEGGVTESVTSETELDASTSALAESVKPTEDEAENSQNTTAPERAESTDQLEANEPQTQESEADKPTPDEPQVTESDTKEHEAEEPKIEPSRPRTYTMETLRLETPQRREERERNTTVSVSHVVTNVIILQSFLLELAALIQVRAGLFDEVKFV